jgi:hypothetical protein
MKKIDLGQTINTVANIGVIAGIVFLGFELRYNSNLGNAGTAIEAASLWTGWKNVVISDAETADLYVKGLEDFEQLSQVEKVRFDLLMRSVFQAVTAAAYARSVGIVPIGESPEDRMLEGDLLRLMDSPGFQQWWLSADRRGMGRTVLEMVDGLSAD